MICNLISSEIDRHLLLLNLTVTLSVPFEHVRKILLSWIEKGSDKSNDLFIFEGKKNKICLRKPYAAVIATVYN